MTAIVQVLAVIGFAVLALTCVGICVATLLVGAIVLERLTGVPVDQRRMLLESRTEYHARVSEPTREDWALMAQLIAAEDARREQVAGNVVSLEGWRASHHRLGGAA